MVLCFPEGIFLSLIMPIIYGTMVDSILIYTIVMANLAHHSKQIGTSSSSTTAERRNKSFTRIGAIMLGILLVTWSPLFIEVSVPYPDPVMDPQKMQIRTLIHDIVKLVYLSNGLLLNCVVYVMQHGDYRAAYVGLFTRKHLVTSSVSQDHST